MRWRTTAVAVLLFTLLSGEARACAQYLDWGGLGPLVSSRASDPVHLDAEGLPVIRYSFGTYRNPAMTASWGLQNYSWWCRRNFADDAALPKANWRTANLTTALRMADALVADQSRDGAWYYEFPFRAPGISMAPPWPSAIAQGMAISLLVRAHAVTGERRYLRAAIRATAPFSRPFQTGGIRQLWNSHAWYEEYPGPNPIHVLNGFEFSLLGLHDLARNSTAARRLFEAGIRSLVWALPFYDRGAVGSTYGYNYGIATPGYLHWHVILTRELFEATDEPVLAYYADRWEAVLRSHGW